MKTPLDPRHKRREEIVQQLFAWQAQSRAKEQLSDQKSIEVAQNIITIDNIIKDCAPEWELDKINQIDLAILRLAVFELAIEHQEPPKAIIDEAIELAKEFGNESSPAFINGALGKALTNKGRVLRLIADKLGTEEKRLTAQANLKADLNVTDLEIADLITSLEQNLSITIGPSDQIETIGNILDLIDEQS